MQGPQAAADVVNPSPSLVVLGLAAVLLVCSSVGSVLVLFLAWRAVEDAMLGWLVLGTLFGVPFVGSLGAAAVDADRRIGRPLRAAWWLVAWGLGMMAHWAPLAIWPLVLGLAAFAEPHRFEQHAVDALWSTGALLGVGLGLAAVHFGRRRLARPLDRLLAPAERPQSAQGASVWSGIAIGWASSILSMVWVVFMVEDGWQIGGMLWLGTWGLLGLALAVTFGGWLATIGAGRDHALRAAGTGLLGQAVVPFLFALSPALQREPELQYAYLLVTVLLATGGAFLWGWARPLPPSVTSASGSAG